MLMLKVYQIRLKEKVQARGVSGGEGTLSFLGLFYKKEKWGGGGLVGGGPAGLLKERRKSPS